MTPTRRLLWLLLLAGCTGATAQDASAGPQPAPVTVEVVRQTELRESHRAHGVLRASEAAMVAFLEGGRLAARPVEVGERVHAAQIVARLEDPGTREGVRAARASLGELEERHAQLERDEARTEALAAEGVATTEALERVRSARQRVRASRNAARALLSDARRRRSETRLSSPFDGVVTDVFAEPGELLGPGQPVVRVVGEGGLEVVVRVAAELAAELEPRSRVGVQVSGGDPEDPLGSPVYSGRIVHVADAAALGGMHPVRIALGEREGLAPGQGVVVRLEGAPRPTVTVPLSAVQDPSGTRPFVWLAVNGAAERAPVRLGPLQDGAIAIRDGLSTGDRVVVSGHARLLEGDRLEGAER